MTRASKYNFYFKEVDETKFLLIEENNRGTSLTNEIDKVVEEIFQHRKDLIQRHHIVLYSDSFGVWDQYRPLYDDYVYVGGTSSDNAIQKFLEKSKTVNAHS